MASGYKKPLSAPEHLVRLANYKMPFGKYKNRYLVNIPEPYYVWFKQKGFPPGTLGNLLQEMYEIKLNGLEDLIRPLIRK
jgi:uncharacterized protein (DUF3820 family)